MKELVNKLIMNAHIFIIAYGVYGAWISYDEHTLAVQQIETQFPGIEKEISANKKKVKEIQDAMKKTDEFKLRVEAVAKSIETAQTQLPRDINDTQILSYFDSEFKKLNLRDHTSTPEKEVPSTYYISKDYKLSANGTFLQFLIFFERLGNATRIYNVKSLKLYVGDGPQKGRFQMINGEGIIQAFRQNPDFKVDRGFDKIENKFPVKKQ